MVKTKTRTDFKKKPSLKTNKSKQDITPRPPVKKALIVGINYMGTSDELSGCIQDAYSMKAMLIKHLGYKPQNIMMLTDNSHNDYKPYYNNIIREINHLVRDVRAGDHLFFHYSGHGNHVRDQNGDELDGYDECLIPLDYKRHIILDDTIRTLLVDKVPVGAHLFGLMDCCNSGSIFDLRYTMAERTTTIKHKINRANYSSYWDYVKAYITSGGYTYETTTRTELDITPTQPDTKGHILMLSGCKDNQVSSDINWGTVVGGALTLSFLSVLQEHNYIIDSHTLLTKVRHTVSTVYRSEQIPQLSFGYMSDMEAVIDF